MRTKIEVIVKMQKKPGWVCQGRCERRIEVIVKMQKQVGGGGGRGVQSGVGGWLVAWLGVRGDVAYGGCNQRKEGIVQHYK